MEGILVHALEWMKILFAGVGGAGAWSFYKSWREGKLIGSQAKKIDQEIQQNEVSFEVGQIKDLYETMKAERDFYKNDNISLREENSKLHTAIGTLKGELNRIQETLDATQRELKATRQTLEELQEQLLQSDSRRLEDSGPTDYTNY